MAASLVPVDLKKKILQTYNATVNPTKRDMMPGSAYFAKIKKFIDDHYVFGELFMEYLKGSCLSKNGTLCQWCRDNRWIGPEIGRIPQPMPDPQKLPEYHYMSVQDTPIVSEDGLPRKPDDFNPRANIKKYVEEQKLNTEQDINSFCDTFAVKKEQVRSYINHLKTLNFMKHIRSNQRKEDTQMKTDKSVNDYDWQGLLRDGKLGKLTVSELNKYLQHYQLPCTGKKADKVRTVVAHLARGTVYDVHVENDSEDSESDEDIVLENIGSGSDSEICSDSDEYSTASDVHIAPKTSENTISRRSGRNITKKTYDDYYVY